MIKQRFKRTAALGMCCTMVALGTVSAMPNDISSREVLPIQELGIREDLLEKQREIDKYIFRTHADEIAELGFTVTTTGPREEYVEIGILPYSEENANYLYEVFGEKKVKVVEGVQAVTLPISADTNEAYENKIIREDVGIGVQVDGQRLPLDVEPFIENSRTLIPLRGVMEKLGAEVEWDGAREVVEVHTENVSIELLIGEDTARVVRNVEGTLKEEIIKLDVPAKLVESRTFIPGRFVTEALGAKVEWDNASRVMIIETGRNGNVGDVEGVIDFEIVNYKMMEENQAIAKWYMDNFEAEGIHSLIDGEWKYVLVSAGEKSTGGYDLQVENTFKTSPGAAYIYATLKSPDKDAFVTQALTYPNVLIRFPKENINEVQGDIVDMQDDGNIIENEIGESLEEMNKAIPVDSIKEMKLYSLMGEEIKTFQADEIKVIMNQLNTGATYNGAYILMLAGNSITITLEGGDSIQLTSYGNEDHVIMSGEVDGEFISYCIISPEVGKILLSQTNL